MNNILWCLLFVTTFISVSNGDDMSVIKENPLHRKWYIFVDEKKYFNHDGSIYDELTAFRDTLENKDVTFEFNAENRFFSVEGEGSYTLSGDSIHMCFDDGDADQMKSSFQYHVDDENILTFSIHVKNDFFVSHRIMYAKPLQ